MTDQPTGRAKAAYVVSDDQIRDAMRRATVAAVAVKDNDAAKALALFGLVIVGLCERAGIQGYKDSDQCNPKNN